MTCTRRSAAFLAVALLLGTGLFPPTAARAQAHETGAAEAEATRPPEEAIHDGAASRPQEVDIERSLPSDVEEEKNVSQWLDALFKPAVDFLAGIFFFDPFAAVGLYDPVLYDDSGEPVLGEDGRPVMVGTLGTDEAGNTIVLAGTEEVSTGHTGKALLHADGTPVTRNVPFVVVWLVFGAIFFTIRMGFVNLRGFRHALDLVRGKYDDPNEPGEVSHFKALATALSATVGLGNIAGVAVAISVGGPGATFWMIVAGLLGMSSKFVECTLGVKYRAIDAKGHVSGGPMYYLSRALEARGKGGLGKVLAVLFAILCVGGSLGGGNMFQANQALEGLVSQFPSLASDSAGPIFGFVLAFLVGLVIIGGIQSIARVTSFIVPFMCGTYVLAAIVVILINIGDIGDVFAHIFAGAFGADALKGGFLGVLVQGFQRAAFSNEAGIGSASIAHSAAKTDEPVSEGIVALLEPFIDTVVVCTMTASVIIFSGAYHDSGLSGASLTAKAFGDAISWFPYVLTLAVLLFAFSTMISWSYYGLKAWTFLFGGSATADLVYKVLFLLCVVLGSSVKLGAVLDFSDMMILGMAFPNILGLLMLSGEVRRDLDSYWERVVKGGGSASPQMAAPKQDAA